MARIVAVVNQKGGVGKTTTSVNLAAALALCGQKVLLVDADAQASASSGLGIGPQSLEASTYTVLAEPTLTAKELSSLCHKTSVANLSVLPAGPDLYAVEVEIAGAGDRFLRLARALQRLGTPYDTILIDCPPSLGLITLNALCAAESVIIPLQCEYYALEGLSQLTRTLEMVRGNLNDKLEIEGVLLTMFDGRNNLARQVAGDVRRHFGKRVYKAVIPRNIRLSEAPSFGQPALVYDEGCAGSQGYLQVAREYLDPKRRAARAA